MIFKSDKWELDTERITVTNLETGRITVFHEDFIRYHLHYREEYSPELLQKAVDEGNILQHLEDLAINVKDKIEEQKELLLNEDKAYLVALESGNLLEVGRIANAYKELAKESVYASMVYV